LGLTPVKTELERYSAIVDAGEGLRYAKGDGACAWEKHAGLLLALHRELKAMVKEFVPPDDIGDDGYIREGRPRTNPHVSYLQRSFVDRQLIQFQKSPKTWACTDPRIAFKEAIK
jgi:hypothetical protein